MSTFTDDTKTAVTFTDEAGHSVSFTDELGHTSSFTEESLGQNIPYRNSYVYRSVLTYRGDLQVQFTDGTKATTTFTDL